ncbi:hypothetical protein SPHINGO8BC_60187 [Sphingobacterium multivorum]|uniref:Uncharacterized protein n=1 Tax=Sphingobacterium multivorum TaxID=28454 RepID=A0A654DP77_SPHMU|nr:hypothetical protein SPHINGO8BC_60187 [Sphingobacterium multivorum]
MEVHDWAWGIVSNGPKPFGNKRGRIKPVIGKRSKSSEPTGQNHESESCSPVQNIKGLSFRKK